MPDTEPSKPSQEQEPTTGSEPASQSKAAPTPPAEQNASQEAPASTSKPESETKPAPETSGRDTTDLERTANEKPIKNRNFSDDSGHATNGQVTDPRIQGDKPTTTVTDSTGPKDEE